MIAFVLFSLYEAINVSIYTSMILQSYSRASLWSNQELMRFETNSLKPCEICIKESHRFCSALSFGFSRWFLDYCCSVCGVVHIF